jgi:hypothetical protein
MLKKILILVVIIITVVSCKKEQYQLKWKIPAEDVLIYKIQMETIDSLSSLSDDNMSVLVSMVASMYGDSIEVPLNSTDLYQGLIRQLNMLAYFSILRKGINNDVKIDFITKQIKEYKEIKYLDIFNKFIKKAFFKGTLTDNGNLIDEKGHNAFDPKINILFELPEKPVAIGESWSLNIKPPDQSLRNSQIDSIKNKVTLTEILIENGDSIALIEYQLQSPDKAGNTLRYSGKGKFNINAGKWIEYTGLLSQKLSGVLPMNHVQRINISEISVETYKSLIKQAQKEDLFKDMNSNINHDIQHPDTEKKKNSEVKNNNFNVGVKNCPEVFRVQILASQSKVSDKVAEFKNIPYQIDEIVINPSEKFRYKYTVGKECEKSNASILLEKIKKLGYTKAYIIKTSSSL